MVSKVSVWYSKQVKIHYSEASKMKDVDHESSDNWKMDDHVDEKERTKIIVHNVNDITNEGLKRLCNNYGTVVNVYKPKSQSYAFIVFSNENEAALAIKQLNLKLGFRYNADFAQEKENVSASPLNEPAVPMTDDDWEQASAKRRFNVGFSLPLPITFPKREPLGTSMNYRSTESVTNLRRTDPELFFRIYKVSETFESVQELDYDAKLRQERLEKLQKVATNDCNNYDDDKNFTHKGLSEKERESFDKITFCVVCKGYGAVYCVNCRTFYCSVQHQKQHYDEHKLQCGKDTIKQSQDAEKSTNVSTCNVLSRDPLPPKAKVFITSILTPDRFYVRSAEAGADREYVKTIGDCAKAALGAVPVVSVQKLAVGDIYLAPYELLGIHGRVLVTEVGPDESKCVFIDHGLVMYVRNDTFLFIDDIELMYRKVQVYKVCLTDITDEYGEREKAIVYLKKLRGHPLQMKYRLENNNIVDVQLHTAAGDSVNDRINKLIVIPPIICSERSNDTGHDVRREAYIMYNEVPQTEPSLGTNRRIIILNRTTILLDARVTWIALEDLPYLENLQNMLECYGKKVSEFRQPYVPREGEMCLVRCLNRWYRGVCHETAGDGKPAVFLCDFGCMTMIDLSNIRKIPAQLATKIVRTHDGIVQGLAEAKADGLTLDSIFLDIYLTENEPIMADITKQMVTKPMLGAAESEKESQIMLNLHELSILLKTREVNK
uniref:RRM domain-containing protein n=1 Tax=Anopheles farauti TaxID=69004 RepID=A0A182Q6J3_9DIPT